MMDASLDTDIVIHLYKGGKSDLLYSSFGRLYIHEYLLETEMKNKSYGNANLNEKMKELRLFLETL